MKIHEIKLNEGFCDSVFCGEKTLKYEKMTVGIRRATSLNLPQ